MYDDEEYQFATEDASAEPNGPSQLKSDADDPPRISQMPDTVRDASAQSVVANDREGAAASNYVPLVESRTCFRLEEMARFSANAAERNLRESKFDLHGRPHVLPKNK
jgi:hypothetical protein